MSTWVSNAGIVVPDLVPAALRARWLADGHCPGHDVYTAFTAWVRTVPDRPAVIDRDGTIDYASLDALVRRYAAALADAGTGAADIVGVQVPNGRDAVAVELAVAAVGAVALPWPPGRGRRDILSLLGRSRAAAAVVADPTELAEVRARLPHLRTVRTVPLPDAGAAWRPRPVPSGAPVRILVSSGTEAISV